MEDLRTICSVKKAHLESHGTLSMKEGRKAELTRVGTGSGRRDRGRGGGEDGPGGGGSRRVWWAKVARNGARAGSVLSFRSEERRVGKECRN